MQAKHKIVVSVCAVFSFRINCLRICKSRPRNFILFFSIYELSIHVKLTWRFPTTFPQMLCFYLDNGLFYHIIKYLDNNIT